MSAKTDRWTEIRGIHREHRTFYQVGGGFTIIALLLLFGGIVFANGVLNDYSTNVYTEAVSAVASVIVTVLILDKRAEQREERRRLADLQTRLVREAGSPDNATALNAVRELEAHDWLRGDAGLLRGARLAYAKLEGAALLEANLARSKMLGASLTGAILWRANLAGAELWGADLEGAVLAGANLTGANLARANLVGANLEYANLARANLRDAAFDEKTVLPDTKITGRNDDSYFQPGVTDMGKYTDSAHVDVDGNPDFWQPEWVKEQQAADRDEPESRTDLTE